MLKCFLNNQVKIYQVITFVACMQHFSISATESFDAKKAWHELETILVTQYAYLDKHENASPLLKEFEALALNTSNEKAFRDVSQQLARNFLDPHLNLGPYDLDDYSVFPTGSDIRAVYQNDTFIVEDIKSGSAAQNANIAIGSEIKKINNRKIKPLLADFFAQPFNQLNTQEIEYGLNVLLGGNRKQERTITFAHKGQLKVIRLAASYDAINTLKQGPTLSYDNFDGIGYIRFHNSLGDNRTAQTFVKAITALQPTRALIIDLRNTPSGGNTGVAEPILGHFVKTKTPYQKFRVQTKTTPYSQAALQTAYITPSKPHYAKPFVVLAGRWTGSMGEGMTIGLDAIGAKAIIGAPLADLLGGIKTVKLTQSKSWLELPFERLYHVDETFREDFIPDTLVIPTDTGNDGQDPALSEAINYLKSLTAF